MRKMAVEFSVWQGWQARRLVVEWIQTFLEQDSFSGFRRLRSPGVIRRNGVRRRMFGPTGKPAVLASANGNRRP